MNDTQTPAEDSPATGEKYDGFSDEERGAMKERAKELKASARGGSSGKKSDDEDAVLDKIAEMEPSDRAMAERVHGLIKASAPDLAPKLWYGMPAYAKDGKVICFFQPAKKFKERYATLGFNGPANLDEGSMWPTAFAITELTGTEEKRIEELVKRAVT